MMFFLARSALCIGAVAAAASGMGTGSLATAIDRGAREAADGAGRACLASSGCLRAGTAALSAASVTAPVGRAETSMQRRPHAAAPHRPGAGGSRAPASPAG